MEEKKWQFRFESIKRKSCQRVPDLSDLPVEKGEFMEGEMILCFKDKLIDGTLEFSVGEVANSAIDYDMPVLDDSNLCKDDELSTWKIKWSETHPEESERFDTFPCHFTASNSSIVHSESRNIMFRALPTLSGYQTEQPELCTRLYRDDQLGVIVHLKPKGPSVIDCPKWKPLAKWRAFWRM